jgi:hypothetical protein
VSFGFPTDELASCRIVRDSMRAADGLAASMSAAPTQGRRSAQDRPAGTVAE